jgi:hypothetical protein
LSGRALNGEPPADVIADLGATFEDFRREQNGGERFKPITARELAEGDFRVNWHIDLVLVDGQPCILAGPKKSLKTTLLCLMALCLATGSKFLGKFHVRRACRVVFFSAESGAGTLQETFTRIAKWMGWELADVPNFTLITDIPRLDSPDDMAAFEAAIGDADVVILDPAYLMMPGGDAGNLFIQGAMLLNLSRVCQRLGVTPVICHHTRKHRTADLAAFDPPELEDIAWAGFQEFARQWLLVGRRQRYIAGTGEHRLWLNYGGSAGHGGLWALDITEGTTGEGKSRYYEMKLAKPSEVRDEADKQKAEAKAAQLAKQLTMERQAVCAVLAKHPAGMSWSKACRDASISTRRWALLKTAMLEERDIEEVEIVFGNHKTPQAGVKLAEKEAA